LDKFSDLNQVSRREVKEVIKEVPGIGQAKALQLAAAFEIGRRIESQVFEPQPTITTPADIARIYAPRLRDAKKEEFWIVLLNTANKVIGDQKVSEGGLRSSIVEMRGVFQKAILENAASIVCLHNHPSGNLEPSPQDISVTKQLVDAGKLMGIRVQDHLIIAGRGFTSLAERGYV
jgi:DNA repair protein RadC